MDTLRLSRDELEYELLVRGFSGTRTLTVHVMRQALAKKMKNEEIGALINIPINAFDPSSEIDICLGKIVAIQEWVDNFTGTNASYEFLKICTKIQHVVSRLARIECEANEDLKTSVKTLDARIRAEEDKLTQKSELEEERRKDAVDENKEEVRVNTISKPPTVFRKQIPVMHWDIKFDGNIQEMSVNAFLERVNDYRISRNVSEVELCDSAIELLRGQALTWYRSVRSKISSWDDFVRLLKEDYEPFDYGLALWDEIRARTQGAEEPVGAYLASMINLFQRLPKPPTEEEKLQVLRRNILPYYIEGIGLTEIESVEQLHMVCKQLEKNRLLAARFQPPPTSRKNLLESDLAYHGRTRTPAVHATEAFTPSTPSRNFSCWNCHERGHVARDCKKEKRKHCFRCGKPDVTTNTCPRCSGNARGGR